MCGDCEIVEKEQALCKSDAAPLIIDERDPDSSIAAIEKMVSNMKLDFMDVTHTIRDGIYTRTGGVKAGHFIIGTRHRKKNYLHIYKGKIAVWDNINGFRVLTAPHTEISFPGIQRVGYAIEDFEGSNIFETDKTTPEEIEAEMLYPLIVPVKIGEKIFRLMMETRRLMIEASKLQEAKFLC